MASPLGAFDTELRIAAWFDESLLIEEWFSDDLIGEAPAGGAGGPIVEVAGQIAVGQGAGVSSQTVAFPNNVVAGNFLCVPFAWWSDADLTATVTDTRGTSYSILLSTGSGFYGPTSKAKCGIAYGVAPSSGANTVTITPSAGTFYVNVATDEFAANGVVLEVNGGESAVDFTATPSDALTTLSAGDLVVGVLIYEDDAQAGGTEGSGYTRIFFDPTNVRINSGAEFKVAGAAGAEAPNWVLSASSPLPSWRVLTAAFKALEPPGQPAAKRMSAIPGGRQIAPAGGARAW